MTSNCPNTAKHFNISATAVCLLSRNMQTGNRRGIAHLLLLQAAAYLEHLMNGVNEMEYVVCTIQKETGHNCIKFANLLCSTVHFTKISCSHTQSPSATLAAWQYVWNPHLEQANVTKSLELSTMITRP